MQKEFSKVYETVKSNAENAIKLMDKLNGFPYKKYLKANVSTVFTNKKSVIRCQYVLPFNVNESWFQKYNWDMQKYMPLKLTKNDIKDMSHIEIDFYTGINAKGQLFYKLDNLYTLIRDKTGYWIDCAIEDDCGHLSVFGIINKVIEDSKNEKKKTGITYSTTNYELFKDHMKLIVDAFLADDLKMATIAANNLTVGKMLDTI